MPLEQTINTEPLLTIMGIVAAAWAIIPRTRLLQISLNLSWIDWALTGFALLLANYLTFEPLLSSYNLYYSIGPWLPGLDSASATYLIFLAWLTYAYLRSRFGRLPRSNTKKFKELVDRLIATRQYDELALLAEPQLERLIHIEKHESLITPTMIFLSNLASKVSENLSSSIYPDNEPCTTAHNIIQNITNNYDLTSHLSLAYPDICLKLIKADSIIATDFSSRFIESLIKNTGSRLYLELKQNKQLRHPEIAASKRLEVPEKNVLIKELLSNPHRAIINYGTDRAILGTALQLIESNKDLINKLNTPSDHYVDKDEDRCPINTSISMFNIMIHEGIHNGYQNHMNIWFLHHLTSSLIEHTKNGSKYNSWTKTPIKILIERIISMTIDWIIEGAYIDEKNIEKHRQSIMNECNINIEPYGNSGNILSLQEAKEALGPITQDEAVNNALQQKASSTHIDTKNKTNSSQKNILNPLFIPQIAAKLLNEITRIIIYSETMSDDWKELCIEQIVIRYKNTYGILSSINQKTQDKERQLADLMLDQVVKGNHAPPEYRRQLLTHVERLDKEDSKPLRDRLLQAIAEDEAGESSR